MEKNPAQKNWTYFAIYISKLQVPYIYEIDLAPSTMLAFPLIQLLRSSCLSMQKHNKNRLGFACYTVPVTGRFRGLVFALQALEGGATISLRVYVQVQPSITQCHSFFLYLQSKKRDLHETYLFSNLQHIRIWYMYILYIYIYAYKYVFICISTYNPIICVLPVGLSYTIKSKKPTINSSCKSFPQTTSPRAS